MPFKRYLHGLQIALFYVGTSKIDPIETNQDEQFIKS